MITDQAVQCGQPFDTLGQAAPHQQPALLVFDLDVVMGLGPVIAQQQHLSSSVRRDTNEPSEETWAP